MAGLMSDNDCVGDDTNTKPITLPNLGGRQRPSSPNRDFVASMTQELAPAVGGAGVL